MSHLRLRTRMSFGSVELLEFALPDARTLLDLRNHPSVLAFMPSQTPLLLAAHVQWVTQNLKPGGPLRIFIVRQEGRPIGFTVLKGIDETSFEIGVVFPDAAHYPGLPAQTAALMLHLCFDQLHAAVVITFVNTQHGQAIALNRGLGEEVPSAKANELCFKAPREKLLANPRYRRIMARVHRSLRSEQIQWP